MSAIGAAAPVVSSGEVGSAASMAAGGLAAGASVRLFVQVFAPSGAPLGQLNTTTVTATTTNLTYVSAVPAVVSALDGVAWLLNIRGADVDRTPVALSFVIAHADGTAELFIAPEKVTPELRTHLGNAVTVRAREDFVPQLKALTGRKVAVDP